MNSLAEAFSPDYACAKSRFHSLANTLGWNTESHSIKQLDANGNDLTIDIAFCGNDHSNRVTIISSGLHGVEGFFGSAVQLAFLDQLLSKTYRKESIQGRLIFIHALNPYGFAWLRRWNEENIDLNRNFLLTGESPEGSPKFYSHLNNFFNPSKHPSKLEPFLLKAVAIILCYGMPALASTLPVGQYDFPKGLFFGGRNSSKTQQILAANLPRWVGNAEEIVHIDLHTGLGQWATCNLLIENSSQSDRVQRLKQQFRVEKLVASDSENAFYTAKGSLGKWCEVMFSDRQYDFITAEFGTYSVIQVVKALRAENQAHWWANPDSFSYKWAKQLILETFAPTSLSWRKTVVEKGLNILKQAIER
ncbi:MAG: DUF2817 domain-containing protein [Aetokthonos hydrillicola CCALA 1050]|nr:DUF2817 domain-containing protein [Aetokthonos hydrillicola CCALA 1050]